MLASFFKKSEPISFIAIVLLSILLFFLHNYNAITSFNINIVSAFILFIIVIAIASFTISNNNLTQKNYYALFIFVSLFGLFPDAMELTKVSFSHLFLLLAFYRIYGLQFKKSRALKLFDSGFFLGISFLFYPLSILFFALILIAYFSYIKNIEKELFIPILGFLAPLFLSYTYFLIFDDVKNFITLIELNFGFDKTILYDKHLYIPLIGVGLFILFSSYSSLKNLQKGGIETQKNKKLIIAHLLIAFFIISLFNYNIKESIQFIFFPLAVSIGNLFNEIKRNWIKEILVWGFLIGAILHSL